MDKQNTKHSKLRDSILGCWIGKNCGGTLGAPLEIAYGQEEPFNIAWYPKIQEGGLPNDDLEIQLVWLKVLEEVGLDFTVQDLSRYWLNHILYNPDEYGLHKRNLALGLLPPVSGYYNNHFKDCMGCPIRSEIWACIAPGRPRLAARFAIRDAVVDHAGGESVYGELFNVAIESAAFVIKDRTALLEIGLSYLPPECETRRAVQAAIEAHRKGQTWLQARRAVMGNSPHINAQYSPTNIGFQVLGWLYGEDFAEALCLTVNCGYDTDCTGATVGAILGIIGGASSLPAKWTAPLGDGIAVNDWALNRGLRNLTDGPNPIPANLNELTERTLRIEGMVRARFGEPVEDFDQMLAPADLLMLPSPTKVFFPADDLELSVEYHGSPQIARPGGKTVTLSLRNPNPVPVTGRVEVVVPAGWSYSLPEAETTIPACSEIERQLCLEPGNSAAFGNRNVCWFGWRDDQRPFRSLQPIALVGAPVWRMSKPHVPSDRPSDEWIDWVGVPEEQVGAAEDQDGRRGLNRRIYAEGFDLGLDKHLTAPGIIYFQGFLRSPRERAIWFHLNPLGPAAVWLNGKRVFHSNLRRRFRPSLWGTDEGGLHGEVQLREGWNEILIKAVRLPEMDEAKLHFLFSEPPVDGFIDGFAAVTEPEWTAFPWEQSVIRGPALRPTPEFHNHAAAVGEP